MPLALSSVPRSRAFDRENVVLARDRDSDLPAARARERAERAQDNADRSGQGDEGPREDERGVGALAEPDGG